MDWRTCKLVVTNNTERNCGAVMGCFKLLSGRHESRLLLTVAKIPLPDDTP